MRLLYLRTLDSHKHDYERLLMRRGNLLRIKEDLTASGLHQRTTTL